MRTLPLLLSVGMAAPAATPKETCNRKDFDNFDDFVDCQMKNVPAEPVGQPETSPSPAPPPPDLPPRYSSRDRLKLDELVAERDHANRVFVGTLVPGSVLTPAGLITMFIGLSMRHPAADDGGPVCTVGKRCGDTCIEASDECHVGGGALGPLTKEGKRATLIGAGVAAVGIVFVITSIVFRRRSEYFQFEIDRIRF